MVVEERLQLLVGVLREAPPPSSRPRRSQSHGLVQVGQSRVQRLRLCSVRVDVPGQVGPLNLELLQVVPTLVQESGLADLDIASSASSLLLLL